MTLRRRMAWQVVREDGLRSMVLGHKCRLVSYRRARRICAFLRQRGHDVRIRRFGIIVMPRAARMFD